MSKTTIKVYEGAEDVAAYQRALNAIVSRANGFKPEFDAVYKEMEISLDVSRLRKLIFGSGWEELEREASAYVQSQHQAMRPHLTNFYTESMYRLRGNFNPTEFQFRDGLRIPDGLQQPLDFIEMNGDTFVAKPINSAAFEIWVPNDVYGEFETYVKAQNALHDRYGDMVHQLTGSGLYVAPKDMLTKIVPRADIKCLTTLILRGARLF